MWNVAVLQMQNLVVEGVGIWIARILTSEDEIIKLTAFLMCKNQQSVLFSK